MLLRDRPSYPSPLTREKPPPATPPSSSSPRLLPLAKSQAFHPSRPLVARAAGQKRKEPRRPSHGGMWRSSAPYRSPAPFAPPVPPESSDGSNRHDIFSGSFPFPSPPLPHPSLALCSIRCHSDRRSSPCPAMPCSPCPPCHLQPRPRPPVPPAGKPQRRPRKQNKTNPSLWATSRPPLGPPPPRFPPGRRIAGDLRCDEIRWSVREAEVGTLFLGARTLCGWLACTGVGPTGITLHRGPIRRPPPRWCRPGLLLVLFAPFFYLIFFALRLVNRPANRKGEESKARSSASAASCRLRNMIGRPRTKFDRWPLSTQGPSRLE
jgi:hypothetical protein